MPNILVAIPTCHEDSYQDCPVWLRDHPNLSGRPSPQERRDAVRQTWWGALPFDHRFFYGSDPYYEPYEPDCFDYRDDEVELPVPDEFSSHCDKNQAMFRWAFEQGYDWVFRCDDDTFVRPERLKQAAHELTGDQIGYSPGSFESRNYITGGAGFWISRRAIKTVIAAPITRTHEDDLWIGRDVMAHHPELTRTIDTRYFPSPTHYADPVQLRTTDWISAHSVSPQMMGELWGEWRPKW